MTPPWACPIRTPMIYEEVHTMNEKIIKRLAALMSVKSIVTLALTAVFSYLAVAGRIDQDFMTIYAVIIAFYFGTQSQKVQDLVDGDGDE